MSRPVQSVALVGRDVGLWMTALGLVRAFGRTGLKVQVIELPSMLTPVDVFPALPALQGLHGLLGIDETETLRGAGGAFALGQRFSNWSKGEADFLHAYDTQGFAFNSVDFLQYWVKARAQGLKVALEDFSLGAAAAKVGRFLAHTEASLQFSKAAYGYHLDAIGYALLLKRRALRLGAELISARTVAAEVADGRIASVTPAGGEPITADLYIDATGAEAALIGRLPGHGFESWRAWLPCDRLLSGTAKRLDPQPAFANISAFSTGWVGLYPLMHRTAVVAAWDSERMGDAELFETASMLTGLPIADPVVTPFEAGRLSAPWIGNCIAVGDTAVRLDHLDGAGLHLAQISTSHLVANFPVDAARLPEAGLYAAGLIAHAENLRDFQIAHYRLNQRIDDPFWDGARSAEPPAGLAYKLELFGALGRVALYDHETFQPENWTACFIGHGLVPHAWDPKVDAMAPAEMMDHFKNMLRFIAAEVREMPTLESHLELLAPAPTSGGARF